MKFGFLSQNLDLREDYIWNKQAENGRTLFYFEGISKEKYIEDMEKHFESLITHKPEFIMLAELNSPLELQDKLEGILSRNKYLNRMLFTGSFHLLGEDINDAELNSSHIYNYGKTLLGEGTVYHIFIKWNNLRIKIYMRKFHITKGNYTY
ncbi:hypothetical protein F3K44_33110 [Bacillus megaterium]|nr:hypothetical protein [Priestia megaterium]